MSGHTPWVQIRKNPSKHSWPPGRLHDDLQINKKEVFRFGDWSIYDAKNTGGVTNGRWNSFIMHCRAWKEWEPVQRPPATTWIKNETVHNTSDHYKIEAAKRCNANMTAETINICPECGVKIPNEVVALWKLQNFDKIQEFNNE